MTDTIPEVRIDKWLWAMRLYKTRSLAIEACKAGHVKVGGSNAKPSRTVHPGEVIAVQLAEMTRTVKVTGLLDRRVGAAIVPQFCEDLTPPSEYAKVREKHEKKDYYRPKGLGRPTKKERRVLEQLQRETAREREIEDLNDR